MSASDPSPSASRWTAPALFALLCLAWGSGWLALKIGVAALPPLFFAGSRFAAAGAVLLAAVVARSGGADLRRVPRGALAASAVLMIAVNYGLMAWGVQAVASGMAAVVNLTTVPLAMAGFGALHGPASRRGHGGLDERGGFRGRGGFTWQTGAALALGSAGLALLFLPAWAPAAGAAHEIVGAASGTAGAAAATGAASGGALSAASMTGMAAIMAGAACYAWGTTLTKGRLAGAPMLALSALQALCGGGLLLAASAAAEPWAGIPAALTDPVRLGGWGFLVAVSVLSTPAYLALLARWEPTRVAAYAYVCPVIALAEGWLFGGETLSLREAASVALLGLSALGVLRTGARATAPHPGATAPTLSTTWRG